ncbi:MAG TPA: aminoacyl-tRNA hydrolase [Burkholderiales bacterium]|jgi:PTH1 family peptidyl-tRNA hydrolase|nr:aminoacyl-tRNA hydrolase [Burkholderiales bacterium]
MKLVVGLGNPGRQYAATRHNVGFWWIDRLCALDRVALRMEARFHGEIGRLARGGRECWLLKPATYMNASGRAVQALAHFYKFAPEDVLVVHDELDLPPGAAKLKKGGGVAGHNGLKDIAAVLGQDFWRLRIGIGHPGDRALVTGYVLAPPRKEEAEQIEAAIARSLEVWPLLLEGHTERAMHRLHTKV